MAHVDVIRVASKGKPATTTRLSLHTLEQGPFSKLSATIDGVHYDLQVRTGQSDRGPVADLQMRVNGGKKLNFDVKTRSKILRNTSVLLVENSQFKIAMTLQ